MPSPLRLSLDTGALVANWQTLARMSGRAACGAAIKADGYGLGASGVAKRLAAAGCRDFFVATWAEAAALATPGVSLSVLHGVRAEDMAQAIASSARPVLNSAAQVMRWREAGGGICDVMVDTGMNRLGIAPEDVEAGLLDRLVIDTLMSHLACADEDVAMNERQRACFAALAGKTTARRLSLVNSAGLALGKDFLFDLTRPGLALYGGVPRAEFAGIIRQVASPEAQVLQRRRVAAGEAVGYNATWRAHVDTDVAIVNLGYADGCWRSLSARSEARAGAVALPVIGRVSMDLVALDVGLASHLAEGEWVTFDYNLRTASAATGRSQYELLTGMGNRFDRRWSS